MVGKWYNKNDPPHTLDKEKKKRNQTSVVIISSFLCIWFVDFWTIAILMTWFYNLVLFKSSMPTKSEYQKSFTFSSSENIIITFTQSI